MGNSCFTNTKQCLQKHFDICADNNLSNINVEETINIQKEEENKINKLKKYFIQGEKDISEDFYPKYIKQTDKKKRNSGVINLLLIDKNKYEVMLNKLLQQKSIERKGPKRRETIRDGNNLKILVKEVIKEKKENKNNKLKRRASKRRYSLIIKNKDKQKIRQSSTIYRNEYMKCKSVNKILKSQLKKVNTLNEILTDGRSTIFNKKETNKA